MSAATAWAPHNQLRAYGSVVAGRVVNGLTGAPITGAIVQADADNGRSPATGIQTDSGGAFAIQDVSKWPIVLRASKLGYIAGSFGQRYAADSPVPLNANDVKEIVTVPIWPGSILAGRVLEDSGEAVVGRRVEALRLQMVGGRKRFVPRGAAATDDKGRYRISGLLSGTYIVAIPKAEPSGQLSLARYYPDTSSPDSALRIDLAPGDERPNLDFALHATRGFEVRGQLRGLPDGRDVSLKLFTVSPDGSAGVPVIASEIANAVGRFDLPSVPPGNYLLFAVSFPFADSATGMTRGRQQSDGTGLTGVMPGRGVPLVPVPDAPTYWAEQRVTVIDRPLLNVAVPVNEGARIRGRVLFEGSGPSLSTAVLQSIPILMQSADGRDFGSFQVAGLDANAGFQTIGLPAGRYIPLVFSGIGWYQASVTIRGIRQETDWIEVNSGDVSSVEIHMIGSLASLRGSVRTSAGLPAPRATVYLFPENQAQWLDSGSLVIRLLECRAGSDGVYSRLGIQPGRYFVVADAEGAGEMWRDPDILRSLSLRAKTIDIRAGDSAAIDLTVQAAVKK